MESLIFNKKQINQLYQSYHNLLPMEEANSLFSNFLNNINWDNDNTNDFIGLDLSPNDMNLHINNYLKNLPEDTEIEIVFYLVDQIFRIKTDILLDYYKESNHKELIEKLTDLILNESVRFDYFQFYFGLIEKKLINPVEDEENFKVFNYAVKEVFQYSSHSVNDEKLLEETHNKALMMFFEYVNDKELKKQCFCEYIEKINIDLDNPIIKEIYDNYRHEDFSMYYKDYYVIRDLYSLNDNEVLEKDLQTKCLQFNNGKIAQECNIDLKKYNEIFYQCYIYGNKKAKDILEIENILDIQTDKLFVIYINYEDKTKELELFFAKYRKFLELVPTQETEESRYGQDYLDEQWLFVSMYVEMEDKTFNKNVMKKKKV